jgi:hypothetical protein
LRIDCAFDDKITSELASHLRKTGHAVTMQDCIITTKSDAIDDLAAFAIKTNRQDYQIKFFEDVVIFSKNIPIEKMGLKACKQCGFLAKTGADLELHQETHLPKNWIFHHR